MGKLEWAGVILSVQPRIRLNRSFDERSHGYMGYALRLDGVVSGEEAIFWLGVGKASHEKFQFQAGVSVEGNAHPVTDDRLERVNYYKVSGTKVVSINDPADVCVPPWQGVPPELSTYRARGHRRLAASTYESKCINCIWGCKMPVILTIDQWNRDKVKYRIETFCYGPKSCRFYRAGPTRKVPGRNGMSWEEEDWVDDEATAHRALDQ